MTQEIIIDCAFYKDGVCASPINKTCEYCKNIDVSKCYHKQLKRLEQENKELKQVNKDLPDIQMPYVIMYRKIKKECFELEQENRALKDNNNHLQVIIDDSRAENKRFREENEELKREIDDLIDKNIDCNDEYGCNELIRFRSALEEIREGIKCFYGSEDSSNDYKLVKIIDKINEVLNDSES